MTVTTQCLNFVSWLSSWFTPKSEDYHYNIVSSATNPTVGAEITITVTVTDGGGNAVSNHEFTLNKNGTDTTLTTDNNGQATSTYTSSTWGLRTFRVNDTILQVKYSGVKSISSTNFTVREYEDFVTLYASRSYALTNSSSWQQSLGIPSSVTPPNTVVTATTHKSVLARATSGGNVELLNTSGSAINSTSIQFQLMWRK